MKFFIILSTITLVIASPAIYLVARNIRQPDESPAEIIRPIPDPVIISPTSTPMPVATSRIREAVESALTGTKGTYGVAVVNLKTGEKYFRGEHRVFDAGSLYKLWIMATVFDQINKGLLTEDQILSQDIAVLNGKFNIADEAAEQTEGTITLSVKEALNKMITISDNYAALLLSEKVKLSVVRSYLADHGFTESVLGEPPTTTPYETAVFFEKLYRGELADAVSTAKMLDLLKLQQINTKLPKYIPDSVIIAHKTGELGSFSHDAGIVYTDKNDYVIVVFSESDFPQAAEDRIARVSQAVYNYFVSQK
jgi:beta-lactamase class A